MTEIMSMENYSVQKPVSGQKGDVNISIDEYFKKINPIEKVRKWYDAIFEKVNKENEEVWMKIGEKYIGWYSPERAFVSIKVKKTLIRIECFSRGKKIDGSRISNIRFSPRWCVLQ